ANDPGRPCDIQCCTLLALAVISWRISTETISVAPRNIIIDTDPGQDDAFAILFALGSPELEVMALTTVGGNVPLALTARNAQQIAELAGCTDIPVYAGCPRPMVKALKTA